MKRSKNINKFLSQFSNFKDFIILMSLLIILSALLGQMIYIWFQPYFGQDNIFSYSMILLMFVLIACDIALPIIVAWLIRKSEQD